MEPLFPGEPQPLPPRTGITWTVVFGGPPPPPPVRHAAGYEPFVAFVARYGIDPRALFDLWLFAHVVRAHREALESDPALLHAAVVFLGNTLTTRWPNCSWSNGASGLAIHSAAHDLGAEHPGAMTTAPPRSRLGVEGTVPAILHADEARFLEFASVVEAWTGSA